MQNLLSLLGLSLEQHPQEHARDPGLTITCMKMETAQNAADFVHETLQSMKLHTAADEAAFQSILADYAAYMQYAALLQRQLDQAGVQESEYRPMLDQCFAASPTRDVLEAAVLKDMEAEVSPLKEHYMARLTSPGAWTERVRQEKSPSRVTADGRAA